MWIGIRGIPTYATGGVPPGDPILCAVASLSQQAKPRSTVARMTKPRSVLTLGARVASLTHQAKPEAGLIMTTKPIASLEQC